MVSLKTSSVCFHKSFIVRFSKVTLYVETQSTLSVIFKYNEDIHTYHGLGLKKCASYLTSETKVKKDFCLLLTR